jgi:hypothetical protein
MSNKPKEPLSVTHPELALQAFGWDPKTVHPGSGKKLNWKCEIGHVWAATPNNRSAEISSFCPVCTNRRLLKGFNDLASTSPEIAGEAFGWDPSNVITGTQKKLQWICPLEHVYLSTPKHRQRGQGCPFCSGNQVLKGFNDLGTSHPELSTQAFGWDPAQISMGHNKKKAWKCDQGHVWDASPNSRTYKESGCPVCIGKKVLKEFNDLATTHPELAKQAFGWDPTTISAWSHKKADWICEFGHHWNAQLKSRLVSGCPVCTGRKVLQGFNDLRTTHPELAKQAFGWDPTTINAGSHKKLKWQCSDGHIWTSVVHSRTAGRGCPTCANSGFNSTLNGWLYFLHHERWELLQIGITNVPDDRLKDHIRLGWQVIELRGPMDGLIARGWETSILRMLKRHGANLAPIDIAGKFDGYSEAWQQDSFPVKSLRELMDRVIVDEEDPQSPLKK